MAMLSQAEAQGRYRWPPRISGSILFLASRLSARRLCGCLSVRTTRLYSLLSLGEHRPELWWQSCHLGRSPDSDELSFVLSVLLPKEVKDRAWSVL